MVHARASLVGRGTRASDPTGRQAKFPFTKHEYWITGTRATIGNDRNPPSMAHPFFAGDPSTCRACQAACHVDASGRRRRTRRERRRDDGGWKNRRQSSTRSPHVPSNLSSLVGTERRMRPVPLSLGPHVTVLIEEDIGKKSRASSPLSV